MTQTVFIDGAAGTTGLEIHDRLSGRDEFELLVLDNDQRKDADARREALNEADFAILCLPDEAAREAVSMIDPNSKVRVIDASSAHRVADGWAYGFPELVGHDEIANARFVSNPGCYPTGFLALIGTLTKDEILPRDWPYTVHAVSGYSGGGNALIKRFQDDPSIAFRAYGLGLGHKHLPEMQKYAQLKHAPVFSPSVVPAFRGMLVEVPLHLPSVGLADRPMDLAVWLNEWFENSRLVRFHWPTDNPAELLLHSDAAPWDGLDLYVFISEDDIQARLVAKLDNLGKGASGAAVQNLNLMAGLEETAGLTFNAA